MTYLRKSLAFGAGALAVALLAGCAGQSSGVVARNIPTGQISSDAGRPDIAMAPGTPHDLYRTCGIAL